MTARIQLAQRLRERPEIGRAVALVAAHDDGLDALGGLAQLLEEVRLADAGLSGDERDRSASAAGAREELAERGQAALPPDQSRQRRRRERGHALDSGDEAIAAPAHRVNEGRLLAVVADRGARRHDRLRERVARDHHARPDLRHQLGARDHDRALDEATEDVEGLALDRDDPSILTELEQLVIELECAETVDHRSAQYASPRHLKPSSCCAHGTIGRAPFVGS